MIHNQLRKLSRFGNMYVYVLFRFIPIDRGILFTISVVALFLSLYDTRTDGQALWYMRQCNNGWSNNYFLTNPATFTCKHLIINKKTSKTAQISALKTIFVAGVYIINEKTCQEHHSTSDIIQKKTILVEKCKPWVLLYL